VVPAVTPIDHQQASNLMLNRLSFFLLCSVMLFVRSVVADTPVSTDSYESVLRPRTPSAKDETRREVSAQRVATKTAAAESHSGPVANTDSKSNGKPAAAVVAGPGMMPPSMPCDSCPCNTQCGCERRFRSGWFYGSEPFGLCVFGALNSQISNGLAAQLVLYRYDFNNPPVKSAANSIDAANLNPRGRLQLLKVAELLNRVPMPPVVIEASDDPEIDRARRQSVIVALSEAMGSPIPGEWVVVDRPAANPLSGEEAAIIHDNLLRQTESGGVYDANARGSSQGNVQNPNSISPTNINQ
jgi:hypothetical protein